MSVSACGRRRNRGETLTHGLEAAALLGRLALQVARLAVGFALLRGNECLVAIVRVAIARGSQKVAEVEVCRGRIVLLSALNGGGISVVDVEVAVGIVGEQGTRNVHLVL